MLVILFVMVVCDGLDSLSVLIIWKVVIFVVFKVVRNIILVGIVLVIIVLNFLYKLGILLVFNMFLIIENVFFLVIFFEVICSLVFIIETG